MAPRRLLAVAVVGMLAAAAAAARQLDGSDAAAPAPGQAAQQPAAPQAAGKQQPAPVNGTSTPTDSGAVQRWGDDDDDDRDWRRRCCSGGGGNNNNNNNNNNVWWGASSGGCRIKVRAADHQNTPVGATSLTASCHSGEAVTGGGCECNEGESMQTSRPTDDGSGWWCRCHDADHAPLTPREVWVMCMSCWRD